jgi:hypothetical protein
VQNHTHSPQQLSPLDDHWSAFAREACIAPEVPGVFLPDLRVGSRRVAISLATEARIERARLALRRGTIEMRCKLGVARDIRDIWRARPENSINGKFLEFA